MAQRDTYDGFNPPFAETEILRDEHFNFNTMLIDDSLRPQNISNHGINYVA